jgi:transcription elongation factor Elf1
MKINRNTKFSRKKSQDSSPASHTSHSFDSSFTCLRCKGLLVREFCMDINDGTGENGFWALRCLQCGELLDPLILEHRVSKSHPVLTGRSRQRSPVALS